MSINAIPSVCSQLQNTSNVYHDSLCLPGGLRGPSNRGTGTIGPMICGWPLLVPFCDPRPFGIFKLPVLMCLKGASRGIPLLVVLLLRRCGGAPLLNILSCCAHRSGGVVISLGSTEGSREMGLEVKAGRIVLVYLASR